MLPHEREFFISRIRYGKYKIKLKGFNIYVSGPSFEDSYLIAEKYNDSYNECRNEGIQTFDEILESMREWGQWDDDKEEKIETMTENIRKLKRNCFKYRLQKEMLSEAKRYLRLTEKAQSELLDEKYVYFSKSCEGISAAEKQEEFITRCTYTDIGLTSRFDFDQISPMVICNVYHSHLMSEQQIRFLARSDDWGFIFSAHKNNQTKLFEDNGKDMTTDQKNLVTWSNLYSNCKESYEAPTPDVYEDDDVFDGWLIEQSEKQKDENKKKEVDTLTSNPKIANSDEIFVVARNNEDAKRIDNLNTNQGKHKKRQRMALIKSAGGVEEGGFQDQKIDMNVQSNNMFKEKFRRK